MLSESWYAPKQWRSLSTMHTYPIRSQSTFVPRRRIGHGQGRFDKWLLDYYANSHAASGVTRTDPSLEISLGRS
jgi:hypothetical protein